jgi:O-antigen/teichoic acid export membrane protein
MNLLRAGRAVATVLGGQLAVQAIGAITGFVIVRAMPVEEYALYTLALSCISVASILADGGLGQATLALSGPRAADPAALARILATAQVWRARLAALSIALAVTGFLYLAAGLGLPWPPVLATAVVIVPLALLQIFTQLGETPLRARGVVGWLQRLHLEAALLRALASLAALALLPVTALLVLATTLAHTWHFGQVRARCRQDGLSGGTPDPALAPHLRHALSRALPGAVYYCLSGQIGVMLVSIFGNTEDLAGLGALGRFGIVYAVLTAVLGYLFTPWFARRTGGGIRRGYLLALGAFAGLVTATLVLVLLLRRPLLGILGPEYAGLEEEFALLMLTGALATLGGAAHLLAASRNVYAPPYSSIACSLVVQVLAILSQDLGTLSGVLRMTIIVNTWTLLLASGHFLLRPMLPQRLR